MTKNRSFQLTKGNDISFTVSPHNCQALNKIDEIYYLVMVVLLIHPTQNVLIFSPICHS